MKRIFTNGCLDVLHRGHIELLRHCKSLGHVIVGLNSDTSIKRLKGSSRPFFGLEDRIAMLEACRFVDEVHVFEQDTPYDLIKELKPDMIVKGGDYKKEDVVGSDLCEVNIFNYIEGYSTTQILEGLSS